MRCSFLHFCAPRNQCQCSETCQGLHPVLQWAKRRSEPKSVCSKSHVLMSCNLTTSSSRACPAADHCPQQGPDSTPVYWFFLLAVQSPQPLSSAPFSSPVPGAVSALRGLQKGHLLKSPAALGGSRGAGHCSGVGFRVSCLQVAQRQLHCVLQRQPSPGSDTCPQSFCLPHRWAHA
uniref:Uncharacterized protein n=1 Tax=Pipistrellus kuhlii TaxID=59472 RepID=A0A7J7V0N1_PIPKU|nr:hypothetical protein mPipKuh1_008622 [Pipistrellus kuhlii]